MKITIFLNNGQSTTMDCSIMNNGTMHTLARQISRCDLVHTVRAQNAESDQGLDYRKGFTPEGA